MDQTLYDKDLTDLGDKFRFLVRADKAHPNPGTADEWMQVFGDISPSNLFRRFERAAGDKPICITVRSPEKNGFTRITIFHDSMMHHGHEHENQIRLDLYPDKHAKLDGLFLKPESQSKNVAKHYMEAAADLLQDLKIDSLKLTAQGVGSYAWAKFGFTPESEEEWNKLKFSIKWRVKDDGAAIEFDGKKYTLEPAEKRVIDQILESSFKQLPRALPQLTELNRKIGEHEKQDLTVGKALLLDIHWRGKLPINEDHVSFERFCTYAQNKEPSKQRGE